MEALEYHAEDGTFVWRISAGTKKAGALAGNKRADGYTRIKLHKKLYLAHRLAWLVEHGVWPVTLDHIDGNGSNNRIVNLRECTMSQNKANSRSYKNNKSGVKGVFWNKKLERWGASIQCGGKRHHLGLYHTKEEAALAYAASAALFFGEYARAA